jgi:hypothetical protein
MLIVKEGLWDIRIKNTYREDTITSEFLRNPRDNFIKKDGFLLFRGRIYIPNKVRKELV